jgi:hypothetical protein
LSKGAWWSTKLQVGNIKIFKNLIYDRLTKNCQKVAKDIIQAAEFTCFGSLELIYDQYDRYEKVQAMRIYFA